MAVTLSSWLDQALDRTIVLGYGAPGYRIRRRLRGWPADGGRLDGKVVLVTGAASGIGLAAAAGCAAAGASVRVLGRNAERAGDAVRRVRAAAGSARAGDVRPVVCDVADLGELRDFSARFLADEERLDVLVNNAGVMPDDRTSTVDGVELAFATHVLAPWVLTAALAPLLRRAAPSRVVNVTSGGQYGRRLRFGDPESRTDRYSPKKFYARSKRAEVVITQEWAKRLAPHGVHVHAMHPGWVDTPGVRRWMPVFRALTRPVIRDPAQGADTIVWLASAPEAVRTTGLLWHDRAPRPATYAFGAGPDSAAARRELWTYVSDLAGLSPPV